MRNALATLESLRGETDENDEPGDETASDLPPPVSARLTGPEMAHAIRAYLAGRRARDSVLAGDWFADPAWDLMLDLLLCRIERRVVSVSSACIAAAAPPTTALRWIGKLVESGAVIRIPDPDDGRRALLTLDATVAGRLEQWVARHLAAAG